MRKGIVAEVPPVADEARRGWHSGQNLSALQAGKGFWEPQEDVTFVPGDKSNQKRPCGEKPKEVKKSPLKFHQVQG